jgi:hypothetical protein
VQLVSEGEKLWLDTIDDEIASVEWRAAPHAIDMSYESLLDAFSDLRDALDAISIDLGDVEGDVEDLPRPRGLARAPDSERLQLFATLEEVANDASALTSALRRAEESIEDHPDEDFDKRDAAPGNNRAEPGSAVFGLPAHVAELVPEDTRFVMQFLASKHGEFARIGLGKGRLVRWSRGRATVGLGAELPSETLMYTEAFGSFGTRGARAWKGHPKPEDFVGTVEIAIDTHLRQWRTALSEASSLAAACSAWKGRDGRLPFEGLVPLLVSVCRQAEIALLCDADKLLAAARPQA